MSWALATLIQDYEAGALDEGQTIALFQRLLDEDLIGSMEFHYQATAAAMLTFGLIHTRSTETGDHP